MIPRTRDDWEHGPPYYRRRVRRVYIPIQTALLIAPTLVFILWPLLDTRANPWGPWMIAAIFIGYGVLAGSSLWMRASFRREFRVAHDRLCTHCGYNLHALGDAGLCPECGNDFDIARDAGAWKRAGMSVPESPMPPSIKHTPPRASGS